MTMTFAPFDPLEFKSSNSSDAALAAVKREISNILSSYVGWYDPFCELIQNALDAVEARSSHEISSGVKSYIPRIEIIIDLDGNSLTVSDNGIGLDKEKFEQFLAPNFSFKSGKTRGHKGVGATYVAYGFNFMRVSTKVPGFEASGCIVGARSWIKNNASGANPKVEPDTSPAIDPTYDGFDRGVSITVRFDDASHPRNLQWIKASTAESWQRILSVKTGIGSIVLHSSASKTSRIRDLQRAADDLYAKYGSGRKMPDKYSNLDFVYDSWSADELQGLIGPTLNDEEKHVLKTFTPSMSVEFGYTAKLWNQFNDNLGVRANYKVLTSGIQLAANNMPQGETIQVPLTRNIGRQNQVHFLIHFDNYSPDMGRKGFHRELVDFAKNTSKLITDIHLAKMRQHLKANTGVAPDLVRELAIDDWKKGMLEHEVAHPLTLNSEHFFKPTERLSILSAPTREQDVIALFHQLIAGGVIRGIQVMSTNERFTYDGLFKVSFELNISLYQYESYSNPLGIPEETAQALAGKVTDPRVLEYKFSLDGLIEDFSNQDKNIKDIDLCVVWETGSMYKERYGITSLLLPENADQRQYHGITHYLSDLETGAKHCDLIVLDELVSFLNDPDGCAESQRAKYD